MDTANVRFTDQLVDLGLNLVPLCLVLFTLRDFSQLLLEVFHVPHDYEVGNLDARLLKDVLRTA